MRWAVSFLRTLVWTAKQTGGIAEKARGNKNSSPGSPDREVHRRPPVTPTGQTATIPHWTGCALVKEDAAVRAGCFHLSAMSRMDKYGGAERFVAARDWGDCREEGHSCHWEWGFFVG